MEEADLAELRQHMKENNVILRLTESNERDSRWVLRNTGTLDELCVQVCQSVPTLPVSTQGEVSPSRGLGGREMMKYKRILLFDYCQYIFKCIFDCHYIHFKLNLMLTLYSSAR